MTRFLFLWTLSILCVAAISGHAQIYPIQSQINLSPPYSGNLSDYTFPGSQRITVTLNCNDITISNYRVKLRFTIEGLGITLRSKTNLSLEPFIVDGGSPLLLYGDDLAQYLDPRNLDFAGYSRTEFQRTGKLPEGIYRFYVEVLDYNRGTVVSNKGFATAWVILNDPPILNLPANNSKAIIIDPTNIPFTWTPRHSSSPNSAFTSEYVFRLIEIWPSNRNPNDAFLSQTPLYEVETSQTQLVYGPGEPLLIPGRKYAWQIQAKDSEGRDLFKNNGKSEVYVFQFGDAIEMPQNVRKETANATTISLRWEASTGGEIPEQFRIRYRPDGGSRWYEDVTTSYWHTITGLQNNKAYDIQVRAETTRQVSDYTFNQRHSTTLLTTDSTYQCGNPANITLGEMTTPLQNLNPGDIFNYGDFDHFLVSEVQKSPTPGSFSGKAFVRVNGFNRANIEVTFTGIFNSEFVMTSGSWKSTYESGSKMAHLTEVMKKIGEDPPVLDSIAVNPESTLITILTVVDSVYLDSEGKIVVLDEDGVEQKFDQKKNAQGEKQEMIVTDSAGNTWTVDKDGNVSHAEATIAGAFSSRDSLNFTVNFKQNTSDQYGFDKDSKFPMPDKVQINAANYFVGWKSVEKGKQDFVDAFVSANKFPKKVAFKIESQLVSHQPGAEPYTSKLILPGGFDNKQELVAYAKLKEPGSTTESEVILGKLNVVTYEYIARKVIVVPVNGVTPPSGAQVQTRLNQIYGQAVAGWQVTIAPNFQIAESFLTKLDEEESGNLASYNKKMREFNRQYRNSNPGFDKTAFYIFLIKGTDYRFNAFMPFKRGIGYVFVEKLQMPKDATWAIAHELGHGAFNLRHTFDEHAVAESSTDNLMDYKGGVELKKYQWDNVHNPESMVGWLQDDEEGAASWTIIDKKHTILFNHIYDRHRLANQYYLDKVRASNKEFIDIEYDSTEEDGDWINDWKIRVIDLNKAFTDDLKSILTTAHGEKIPEIALRPKHIYLGNYSHNGQVYPVAVYGNGSQTNMKNTFTKVIVSDLDDLELPENRKHIYVEETYTKYFVIAFYEQNKTEPSVIMQIEKFAFTNSIERWLRYLKILVEPNPATIFLDDITWTGQFDEDVFGECSGCWPSTCCRRAAEYMMGNTNIANCSNETIAETAPNMPILEKIVTSSFSNNSINYTSTTYNQAILSCDSVQANRAINYIEQRLNEEKPVLLGVHYTNGNSDPPNNANKATRHFMVIVGITRTKEETSIRFYDPGRSEDKIGYATSSNNLLKLETNGCVTGFYFSKQYTMSEVLKTN